MNKKEVFQMGADAVAKPMEKKLDDVAEALKQSAGAEKIQELTDAVIEGMDEMNHKSANLSKLTQIKDIEEDRDVSIIITLAKKYCAEDGFEKNEKVNAFLNGLLGIDRSYTSDLGIEYDSIGDTEEAMPCSKLLYIIIIACNIYSGNHYNQSAYDQIMDNICIRQKDKISLCVEVSEVVPLYHPNKFASLLSGYDFDVMFAKREKEFSDFQNELKEKEEKLNKKENLQILKDQELKEKEEKLNSDIAKSGKAHKIRCAVETLAEHNKNVYLAKNIPERMKTVLANKIGRGQITAGEILAYYTANIWVSSCMENDIKLANFANGLLITETGLAYHENSTFSGSHFMSYTNIQSVGISLNQIVVKGKEGSKLRIKRHLGDTESIISFINQTMEFVK